MKSKSDRELLKACFSGDRSAWETFVESYSKLVYYSIHSTFRVRGVSPAQDEVDDLFGNVFLSLFEGGFAKLKSFKGKNDCSLASWIRLIASRKTLDYLRERGRYSRLVDTSADIMNNYYSSQDDTEKAALERERSEMAARAISKLKSEDIYFLHLYYERELAPEHIAELLGVTTSTVYSKKNRIREKIKKYIESEEKKGE